MRQATLQTQLSTAIIRLCWTRRNYFFGQDNVMPCLKPTKGGRGRIQNTYPDMRQATLQTQLSTAIIRLCWTRRNYFFGQDNVMPCLKPTKGGRIQNTYPDMRQATLQTQLSTAIIRLCWTRRNYFFGQDNVMPCLKPTKGGHVVLRNDTLRHTSTACTNGWKRLVFY